MRKLGFFLKRHRILFLIYRLVFSSIFKFVGIFVRTDPKMALFVSYGGDSFNDSPKVLFDAMKNDSFFEDYSFVWGLRKPRKIDGAKVVRIDSLKYFFIALKAGIWITNVNIERGLRFKKKKTVYLNTWHGTGPKKSGGAIKGRRDYNFSNVDILCIDGEYTKSHFIDFFGAKESSMLLCGRPREDRLFDFDEKTIAYLKQKIGIPNNKKAILYAPTWRDKKVKLMDAASLLNSLGDDFVLIVRSHHFSEDQFLSLSNNVIDATNYLDVNDLYLVSDYLVSDYSSAFFDYGLLKRPFYCFASDYDSYINTTGLFIDIRNEFVGGVFDSEKKLAKHITESDYTKESALCYDICKKYVELHRNATQLCIDAIKEKLRTQ